jgi:hypothetical protein
VFIDGDRASGVTPGTTAGASWCGINDRIHFSASLFVGGGRVGRSVARPQALAVPERSAYAGGDRGACVYAAASLSTAAVVSAPVLQQLGP